MDWNIVFNSAVGVAIVGAVFKIGELIIANALGKDKDRAAINHARFLTARSRLIETNAALYGGAFEFLFNHKQEPYHDAWDQFRMATQEFMIFIQKHQHLKDALQRVEMCYIESGATSARESDEQRSKRFKKIAEANKVFRDFQIDLDKEFGK